MESSGVLTRVPLSQLDPNRDLNAPRLLTPRAPITFDAENECEVIRGLRRGIYDFHQVLHLTDPDCFPLPEDQTQYTDPAMDDEAFEQDADLGVQPHEDFSTEQPEYASEGYMDEDDEAMEEVPEEEMADAAQDDADEHIDDSPPFDPAALGLREINNLAHFGVSSHKPGNGVAELLSDDLGQYWQYVTHSF